MLSPTITGALEAGRRKAASDIEYQKRLARHYREAFKAVSEEMLLLGKHIERQAALGAPVSPSWLSRQERYLSLQTQLAAAVRDYGGTVTDLLEQQRAAAVRAGLDGLASTMQGFQSGWAMLDKRAFEAAMAALELNRSPLKQLIEGMGDNVLSQFKDVWAGGMAAGHNPLKIARALNHTIQGMTQGRAQLIARTEWHRAVRSARSEAFQKSDVVKSWIWRAALDGRTCGICYVNHGTEHKTDEMLPGHPGCRCTMVPKTVEWSDLGLPGVPRTQPKFEPGSSSFRRLPEKEQRRLIGRKRLEMFKAGTPLKAMTHTVPNSIWGSMAKFKALPPGGVPSAGGKRGSPLSEAAYANPKKFSDNYSTAEHQRMVDYGGSWGNLPNYTAEEMDALRVYQGSGYNQINEHLRAGLIGTSETVRHVSHIDTAMDKGSGTPETLLVRRGTGFSGIGLDIEYGERGAPATYAAVKAKMGSTQVEPGYLSTSMMGGFSKPVLLEIVVPKGTKGVVMTGQNVGSKFGDATSNGEAEILFPRGSRILMQSVTPVGNKYEVVYHIKCRLVV